MDPITGVCTNPPPPAEWMSQVAPGRLDFRIVLQTDWWVTRDGQVLELIQLTHPHVRNIIAMLQEMAMLLHLWAMASALVEPGTLAAEVVTHQLTGSSIASVGPQEWLESTPLMRALRWLDDTWDTLDDDDPSYAPAPTPDGLP